jgi:hypothetical protein
MHSLGSIKFSFWENISFSHMVLLKLCLEMKVANVNNFCKGLSNDISCTIWVWSNFSFWKKKNSSFFPYVNHMLCVAVVAILNFWLTKKLTSLHGHIWNILAKEQFHHTCDFGEEFWNLSQSDSIIGSSSYVEFPNEMKII